MSKDILIEAGNLSSSLLKKTRSKLGSASAKLGSINNSLIYYSSTGYSSLYPSSVSADAIRLKSSIDAIQEKLRLYADILDVGPDSICEVDAKCKNDLTSWWDRTEYKFSNSAFGIATATIGALVVDVFQDTATEKENIDHMGILKNNNKPSTSGSTASLLSTTTDKERSKVKIGDEDEASDVISSTKDAIIDNRRKDQGREGEKEEYERYIYSSTDSGAVSILGTDFRYDKYTDYTGGSISSTDGDRFYSMNTAFGKEGTHIDFEATDGSGLSGDITMNGITAYGTGEFDLAKGNAYIKAGADYSMYSLTVESTGDMGSFSLTGEVGAGLHLDAGIHDGKITVDAGVALGLGIGFSIEFDYKAFWDATCDAFGF